MPRVGPAGGLSGNETGVLSRSWANPGSGEPGVGREAGAPAHSFADFLEAVMNLQMQMRRGLIALAIGLVLAGLATARAGSGHAEAARGVGSVIRAVDASANCGSSLRIDLAGSVHLTVPCDLSCAPMRSVLHTLHLAATRQLRCAATHTA